VQFALGRATNFPDREQPRTTPRRFARTDFYFAYLRLAEISVAQLVPQVRDSVRSAFSHTAKPTKTITVTTSLARVLSFIIPTVEPTGPISDGGHRTIRHEAPGADRSGSAAGGDRLQDTNLPSRMHAARYADGKKPATPCHRYARWKVA
jgi:hypothetical protein